MKRNRERMAKMRAKLTAQQAEVRALRRELKNRETLGTKAPRPTQKNVYRRNKEGVPIAREVPEVRQWKQNPDGSVTGLIYNSRDFNDGTEVTTSPAPLGARSGLVTTRTGTQFLLK